MARFKVWYWCAIGCAFVFAGTALADSDSIGPKGINSAGLGLTGSGVRIGQVERGRPGDADVGDDLAHRNTTTNPAGVFIQNIPGNAPPNTDDVRPHAQEVAGVMISTDMTDGTAPPQVVNGIAPTGVATGALLYSSAYISLDTDPGYEDAILTVQRIATITGMRAVNHSWGKEEVDVTNPNNGESLLTMAIDWSAYWHNVLHIVAGNQGDTADVPVPKDNYNGMTIGRSAKAADGVYRQVSSRNNYDADAFGARTSISLIAPGDDIELATLGDAHRIASGSSYAAPHVTGTVALLQQNASTTNQRRHEVMKAVLMNSADKIKGIMGMERTVLKTTGSTWFDSTADTDPDIPLDMEMGTGHLNANRALQQFNSGEQDPGGVSPIGWDYNYQDDEFLPNNYSLVLNAGDFVSATLVWDRLLSLDLFEFEYQPGDDFIDFGFPDLDLYLRSSGGSVIKASTSADSNVEHIFAQVPSAGTYTLGVSPFVENLPFALAWWAGADARPAPGDYSGDGVVDAADYTVWRDNWSGPGVPGNSVADGDDDGDVDEADFVVWKTHFGQTAPGSGASAAASTAVPEPTGAVLAVVATFGAMAVSRRRWRTSPL